MMSGSLPSGRNYKYLCLKKSTDQTEREGKWDCARESEFSASFAQSKKTILNKGKNDSGPIPGGHR